MKKAQKQPKPSITKESAALILKHHFGNKVKALQPIQGGLANHVFEADVGGKEIVLRMSTRPEKLQMFMKEQWAVTAARRKKVPTPEILEVCNDIIGLPYMISSKVAGRPASTIGRHRMGVIHEMGRYTAIINSIPTHDFGHIFDWSPNKLSRNRTWTEYLDNELRVDERINIFRQSGVLDAAHLKKLCAAVKSMRRWTARPTLSHADMRLKNVILDDQGKICAILDWENCISQIAPYWELSIALHDLTMDEKGAFLAGYGIDLKEYMKMSDPIKVFNILNYSRVAQHGWERKDKARLLSLRARLNGTFDLYSL